MKFYAKHVSVGEFDDQYFQVSFDSEPPSEDEFDLSRPDHPYLIVQRQFEDDDGGVCYIERPMIMMPTQATSACSSLSSHLHASSSRSRGRKTSTSRWPMTWTRRSLVR